jgi:hypothetical protein
MICARAWVGRPAEDEAVGERADAAHRGGVIGAEQNLRPAHLRQRQPDGGYVAA